MSSSINPQNNRDLNQGILHLWSKFGGPSPNGWWVIARTSSKWGKFWLWSKIWPWRSRSITPKNNRDLYQGLLHLWSKFGDPSLNGSRVIAWTSKWLTHRLTHTHGHTHTNFNEPSQLVFHLENIKIGLERTSGIKVFESMTYYITFWPHSLW